MKAGEPDRDDVPPVGESLAGRIVRIGRAKKAMGAPKAISPWRWREAALIAGLIGLGPVLTIAGAQVLAARERGQADRLEAQLAPRTARRVEAEQAREQLARALERATLAVTLDVLARALPRDASLARAERSADGTLQLRVRTPDPDALRSALRRAPAFARLREVGQQRSDAAMIVSLRGETE